MPTYSLQDFLKHTSELATISPAAVELINKINLPSTRRDEIAKLVSTDEILFANIFKYTNSAALGLVRRPQTVIEAIDILGLNEIRNLVFAVAAKKVFVDLDLWHQSVFTAFTAQEFAKKIGLKQDDISNIYIAGLMRSMGTLIFKMFYKDDYSKVKDIKDRKERSDSERKIFGISNYDLAYEIVKDYGLPEAIVEIIKNQGDGWESDKFGQKNAMIDLAVSLSELSKGDLEDQDLIKEAMNSEMLTKFELNSLTVDTEFLKEIHERTDNFVNF